MNMLEIEVKFHLTSSSQIIRLITDHGGVSLYKGFEYNLRFDTSCENLRNNGMLLRLRKENKSSLTLKTNPPLKDSSFKIQNEYEVFVSDFGVTRTILERLGYRSVQVYEKERETFSYKSGKLMADSLPYGDFLEIEGEKGTIRYIADELGFNWDERITMNYLQMFDIIKKEEGLLFSDITFENFKGVAIDINKYIPIFRLKAEG
ncbi:MAG: class IV adenylate cyclase [Pseudomonadota bacterium]